MRASLEPSSTIGEGSVCGGYGAPPSTGWQGAQGENAAPPGACHRGIPRFVVGASAPGKPTSNRYSVSLLAAKEFVRRNEGDARGLRRLAICLLIAHTEAILRPGLILG